MNQLPRIAYIDERDSDRREFVRRSNRRFDVVDIHPLPEIQDTVDRIREESVEAVVSDYNLKEYETGTKYNGSELVQAIRDQYPMMPCFILTSYAQDAVGDVSDVNTVYPKSEISGEASRSVPLLERIEFQIARTREMIENTRTEFLELKRKMDSGESTDMDEERLLELDGLLEGTLSSRTRLPSRLKSTDQLGRLAELLARAEAVLGARGDN